MSFRPYDQKYKPYNRKYQPNHRRNNNGPPVEIPDEFKSTRESLKRTYDKIQHQNNERQIDRKIKETIREQEERSAYGLKRVNLDDDEEDEHAIPMVH